MTFVHTIIKSFIKNCFLHQSAQLFILSLLHILNDGYNATLLLLLPFIAKDMQLNLTQVGLLGTFVNSLSIVLALPAGYIATRMGGMRVLIIGLFTYAVGFLITGFAPSYIWLFITFIVAGIGIGVFHPIGFALVAKWSTKENRGRQMGNFTAIGDVGKIGIAAVLTLVIVYIGWRYTTMIFAAIAIAISIILYLFFLSKTEHGHEKQKTIAPIKLKEIITYKKFLFATGATFLDAFASSSLFIFLPFLLLKRGVNPALLGSFAAAFFIGNFIGKTLLGRVVDTFGNTKIFIISEFLMAVFILLLSNSHAFIIIIACSIILGMFTKGTVPVLQTMVSESAEHHGHFEKTFAANALVSSIGTTIAPLLLGFISDKLGIISAFNAMAGIALLAIVPAFAFHKHR